MRANKIGVDNRKRWTRLAFLILIWAVIWSLINDFSKVRKGFLRIDESQNRLTQAQIENLELKREMVDVQTDFYKEKMIRNKMNMQLPGETIVVLPQKEEQGGSVGEEDEKVEKNWEKWWRIVR